MKRFYVKLLVVMFVCVLPQWVAAQSACDKLFANGVKLQQTMTVSSQQRAIVQFEKAKICYDSQSKKDLCDQQIKACRNIIAQIEKSNKEKKEEEKPATPQVPAVRDDKDKMSVTPVRENVELSLGENYIKFKGKGNEFIKVKVNCNYSDWEVVEAPDWVNYSRNDENELVIEAQRNPIKGERSGMLRVRCGNVDVSLTIIQERYKKFVVI